MTSSEQPERPHTPYHSHQNSYGSNHHQYHSFSSASPPSAYRHAGHLGSPTLTTTISSSPSAPSETFDDDQARLRYYSHGSEVNYAELTSSAPQFISKSRSGDAEKEAYRDSILPAHDRSNEASHNDVRDGLHLDEKRRPRRRRKCGMRVPVFWTVVVVVLLAVLALALGLGLGLGRKKHASSSGTHGETQASQTLIGGAIDPKYYSLQGAFNGSGIAIASANQGTLADIFVFYQRYTKEIVQLYFAADGSWHTVTTVASNAKNATPISAVAYVYNQVATTHLFYIDQDNFIRQKITSNSSESQTNIWYNGPLNDLNLKSYNSELVGMQACYWGNYYGSSSNFNQTGYPTKSEPTTGINFFYATDSSTFNQYDWTNGQRAWNFSNSFPGMNTRAGIGCQSWLTNTTQYLAMVDVTNRLRILWRDTDNNKTSTAAHPIGVWTNTTVSFPDVHPSTSLGYTDFLAYQDSDATIRGVDIKWAAENTSIATISSTSSTFDAWAIDASSKGIPGTHLAITALNTASGGRQLAVFYQSIASSDGGDGMSIGWRDSSYQGSWSYASVPVNQTV